MAGFSFLISNRAGKATSRTGRCAINPALSVAGDFASACNLDYGFTGIALRVPTEKPWPSTFPVEPPVRCLLL